jgi:hypothetical protein
VRIGGAPPPPPQPASAKEMAKIPGNKPFPSLLGRGAGRLAGQTEVLLLLDVGLVKRPQARIVIT